MDKMRPSSSSAARQPLRSVPSVFAGSGAALLAAALVVHKEVQK